MSEIDEVYKICGHYRIYGDCKECSINKECKLQDALNGLDNNIRKDQHKKTLDKVNVEKIRSGEECEHEFCKDYAACQIDTYIHLKLEKLKEGKNV